MNILFIMILLIDGFVKLPSWHKLWKEQHNSQISKAMYVSSPKGCHGFRLFFHILPSSFLRLQQWWVLAKGTAALSGRRHMPPWWILKDPSGSEWRVRVKSFTVQVSTRTVAWVYIRLFPPVETTQNQSLTLPKDWIGMVLLLWVTTPGPYFVGNFISYFFTTAWTLAL